MERREISNWKAILFGMLIGDMLFVGCAKHAEQAQNTRASTPNPGVVTEEYQLPKEYRPEQWRQLQNEIGSFLENPQILAEQGVLAELFPIAVPDGMQPDKIEVPEDVKIPSDADFDESFKRWWEDTFTQQDVKKCVAEVQGLHPSLKKDWDNLGSLDREGVRSLLGKMDSRLGEVAVWSGPTGDDWREKADDLVQLLKARQRSGGQDQQVIGAAIRAAEGWRDQAEKVVAAARKLAEDTKSLRRNALMLLKPSPGEEAFKIGLAKAADEFKRRVTDLVSGGQYQVLATENALLTARSIELTETLRKADMLDVHAGAAIKRHEYGTGLLPGSLSLAGSLVSVLTSPAQPSGSEQGADADTDSQEANQSGTPGNKQGDQERHVTEYAILTLASVLVTFCVACYCLSNVAGVAVAGWWVLVIVLVVILVIALIYWCYMRYGTKDSTGNDGPGDDPKEPPTMSGDDVKYGTEEPSPPMETDEALTSSEQSTVGKVDKPDEPAKPEPKPVDSSTTGKELELPEGAETVEITTSENLKEKGVKVLAFEPEGKSDVVVFRIVLDDKSSFEATIRRVDELNPVLGDAAILSAVSTSNKEGHYWLDFTVKPTGQVEKEADDQKGQSIRLEVDTSGSVTRL